jgi:hypothetical protein
MYWTNGKATLNGTERRQLRSSNQMLPVTLSTIRSVTSVATGYPLENVKGMGKRVDERIRTRAYFRWLTRSNDSLASTLEDWLAAEEEELLLSLVSIAKTAAVPQPFVFTQDDLWFGSTKLADLFGLLGPKLRSRRARSRFLAMIEEYQDYLTSSSSVSDDEAVRIAGNAYRIGRLLSSLVILVGEDLSAVESHTLRKELKDVFANSLISLNTSEFNLYTAANIRLYTGLEVSFIDEGEETSPDLEVNGLAYVECKDVQTTARDNMSKTLEDNLVKAKGQLREAQRSRPLPGSGICIDLPPGSLPLTPSEWDMVRATLSSPEGPDFVWVAAGSKAEQNSIVTNALRDIFEFLAGAEHEVDGFDEERLAGIA